MRQEIDEKTELNKMIIILLVSQSVPRIESQSEEDGLCL